MAHNLYQTANGEHAAFYADRGAWHGLGTVVQGAQTWEDARRLAHLDWLVEKQPLFDGRGEKVNAWGIFRDDNGAFLGAVGKNYTPIQNEYAFDFVDSVLSSAKGAHYESAGVLGTGERIWCLARVPYDFLVDGQDAHKTFLLFTTSHDGSLAATCKLTSVRVVCQNTLTAAVAMNGSFCRVKHTQEAGRKLDAAKRLMGNAVTCAKDLEDKLTTLSHRMLDRKSYLAALDAIFPVPKDTKASSRRENMLSDVTRIFESNDSNAFPDFRGTAFNLLNAITDYTDHQRSVRSTDGLDRNKSDLRREAALFGSGASLKESVLEVLYESTVDCATRPYKTYVTRALENGEAQRSNDRPAAPTGNLLDSILDATIN